MKRHLLDWYKIFLNFNRNFDKTNNLDFSGMVFIDPVIIPLLFQKLNTGKFTVTDPKILDYIKFLLDSYNNPKLTEADNYIPLKQVDNDNIETLSQYISNIILKKSDSSNKNSDKLNYIFGELINNVIQHSKYEHNYILAQYYKNMGLEIIVYDDGIGIPGSLCNITHKSADCEYIHEAINGLSCKEEAGLENERGTALNSIIKMVKSSSDNECIIVSGQGIYEYLEGEESFIEVNEKDSLDGTLVSMIFKNKNKFDSLDIYDYI